MCVCVCVCAQARETQTDRLGGFEKMRRAGWGGRHSLLSTFLEMQTVKEKMESRRRDGMEECTGGERFVCISLEEMKSYYRYSQRCQQLHCEFFLRGPECDVSLSFTCGVLCVRGSWWVGVDRKPDSAFVCARMEMCILVYDAFCTCRDFSRSLSEKPNRDTDDGGWLITFWFRCLNHFTESALQVLRVIFVLLLTPKTLNTL